VWRRREPVEVDLLEAGLAQQVEDLGSARYRHRLAAGAAVAIGGLERLQHVAAQPLAFAVEPVGLLNAAGREFTAGRRIGLP
jgi:hypothetical protein